MISVCMATYNGALYVEQQIDSILKQLGPMDELIVSDDHSTDATLEIIKNFNDPRITIIMNELEKGYVRNFENALMKSRGDIIFLADQDDVWIDGKVDAVVEKLKDYDFVVTDASNTDKDLSITDESHFKLNNVRKGFWINFAKTRYIGACMAFNRIVLNKALPFPSRQENCAHDYWLAMIAEMFFDVCVLDTPYLLYRRHDNNALTGGVVSTNSIPKRIVTRVYVMIHLIKRRFRSS